MNVLSGVGIAAINASVAGLSQITRQGYKYMMHKQMQASLRRCGRGYGGG